MANLIEILTAGVTALFPAPTATLNQQAYQAFARPQNAIYAAAQSPVLSAEQKLEGLIAQANTPPITEEEFNRYIRMETCDQILSNYGVIRTNREDVGQINRGNKHVALLLYANRGEGSKGLSAFHGAISKEIPNFNFYALPVTDGESISKEEFSRLESEYGCTGFPSIILFKRSGQNLSRKETIDGGITTYSNFNRVFSMVKNYIANNF